MTRASERIYLNNWLGCDKHRRELLQIQFVNLVIDVIDVFLDPAA